MATTKTTKAKTTAKKQSASMPVAVAFQHAKVTKSYDRYDPVSADGGLAGVLYLPKASTPSKVIRVTVETETE